MTNVQGRNLNFLLQKPCASLRSLQGGNGSEFVLNLITEWKMFLLPSLLITVIAFLPVISDNLLVIWHRRRPRNILKLSPHPSDDSSWIVHECISLLRSFVKISVADLAVVWNASHRYFLENSYLAIWSGTLAQAQKVLVSSTLIASCQGAIDKGANSILTWKGTALRMATF